MRLDCSDVNSLIEWIRIRPKAHMGQLAVLAKYARPEHRQVMLAAIEQAEQMRREAMARRGK